MNKPMKKRCRKCGVDFEEYAQGPDLCSRCLLKAAKKAGCVI
jgi:predicted amidophosphoribosyltransferase